MTDKSFGDHINRNVIKNPLLSKAVVGLSIEDLTQKAVLLPVAQDSGLILSQDPTTSHINVPDKPSGDAALEKQLNPAENQNIPKQKDDFDVNEYFARLQGTRYVSAPINATVDQNANLDAVEENLEEVNLNDNQSPIYEERSEGLTADIAQNFSQLPQVLPQVASAVFSSFTNYWGKKDTQETKGDTLQTSHAHSYGAENVQAYPEPGVSQYGGVSAGIAPPLNSSAPPLGGAPNTYRITTKKKAYAQIPGLSTNESGQNPPYDPISITNINVSPYFPPQNTEKQANLNFTPNIPQAYSFDSNMIPKTESKSQNELIVDCQTVVKRVIENVLDENNPPNKDIIIHSDLSPSYPSLPESNICNEPNPILPPPTMFATKRESQNNTRNILPPSVARRLNANQPTIKSTSTLPVFNPNIFIPEPIDTFKDSDNYEFKSSTAETQQILDHNKVSTNDLVPLPLLTNLPGSDISKSIDVSTLPSNIVVDTTENQQDTPKPLLMEPPKIATGNVNYRMAKKRPQYYSGPIEGVGSFSNNTKPMIPCDSLNFQGSMFTPESKSFNQQQNYLPDITEQASVPFDLNKPMEVTAISKSNEPAYNVSQPFNTAFDLSRPPATSESPASLKQESTGFGLIGSLKSKLSLIDINKLQNSVTTFFDPAYNDMKKEHPAHASEVALSNYNSGVQHSTLEVYVPNADNSNSYANNSNFTQPTQHQGNQYQLFTPISSYQSNDYHSNQHPNAFYSPAIFNQDYASSTAQSQVTQSLNDLNQGISSLSASTGKDTYYQHGITIIGEKRETNFATELLTVNTVSDPSQESQTVICPQIDGNSAASIEETNSLIYKRESLDTAHQTAELQPDQNALKKPLTTKEGNEFVQIQKQLNKVTLNDTATLHSFSQASTNFFDNLTPLTKDNAQNNELTVDDLNICDTCREVNKPEEKGAHDLTSQLIENITAPIQLSNPVEVPLTESSLFSARGDFSSKQCKDISDITEETMDTIQVHNVTELIESPDTQNLEGSLEVNPVVTENQIYGWLENVTMPNINLEHDYSFQPDPDAIGFTSNNSLFFDNIPNNASDEIKAEFQSAKEDSPTFVFTRQMSIPSAPPAEYLDDNKSEEAGLDVQSIEQDAKKDFPIFEEYVIEPSKTDDDKIEGQERRRSLEDPISGVIGEMANMNSNEFSSPQSVAKLFLESLSPPLKHASYFDTGNYAAETHYRNSLTSPSTINSFNVGSPTQNTTGFSNVLPAVDNSISHSLGSVHNQYGTSAAAVPSPLFKNEIIPIPRIPDTTTQTPITSTVTYGTAKMFLNVEDIAIGAQLPDVSIADILPSEDTSKLPLFSTVILKQDSPKTCQSKENPNAGSASKFSDTVQLSTSDARPKTSYFFFTPEAKNVESLPENKPSFQIPLPDPVNFFSHIDTVKSETKSKTDGQTPFNRLASYFSTPASNKDNNSKPFELSQEQKQNRIGDQSGQATSSLIKDLTSTQFYQPTAEQIVKTVNYFTVDYNDDLTINSPLKSNSNPIDDKIRNLKTNLEEPCLDKNLTSEEIIAKCNDCCSKESGSIIYINEKVEMDLPDMNDKQIIVNDVKAVFITAMDNKNEEVKNVPEPSKDTKSTPESPGKSNTVSFNLNMGEHENEGIDILNEVGIL